VTVAIPGGITPIVDRRGSRHAAEAVEVAWWRGDGRVRCRRRRWAGRQRYRISADADLAGPQVADPGPMVRVAHPGADAGVAGPWATARSGGECLVSCPGL